MEKLEWREVFHRQPSYYLFLDMTIPMSIDNLNTVCQVLQDMIALSVSMKGSQRVSTIGIYALSSRTKCIFPFQSLKNNYSKLQFSIDCFKNTIALCMRTETFNTDQLLESLQTAVQQYEVFYQSVVLDKEEWPQLQLVFFSAQKTQKLLKTVQDSLAAIELAYIRKVHVVMFRDRNFMSSFNSSGSRTEAEISNSQNIFENEETESIIRSLVHVMEVEPNSYQLESILKCWLHDCSTDSEHFRLHVDKMTLRCDIKEYLLNPDSLPVSGQFVFSDLNPAHAQVGRVNPSSKKPSAIKVAVHSLTAVALIKKEGLCESLLFGHPFIALATRCWKMDWDELERNQHRFTALARYLSERNLILLARRQTSQTTANPLPSGFFVFIPSRNSLLVKSLANRELLLPLGEIEENEIPDDVEVETRLCLESLEEKDVCNPISLSSGLYAFLSNLNKSKTRPSTNFVVPMIRKDEDVLDRKRRGPDALAAERSSRKPVVSAFENDFLTASAMLKKQFPQQL